MDGEAGLVESLLGVSEKTVWVILMTGGGHFAGAVYKGSVGSDWLLTTPNRTILPPFS